MIAVVTTIGCGSAKTSTQRPSSSPNASNPGTGSGGDPSGSAPQGTSGSAPPSNGGVTWERVNLGFVSAYILARGGEAAIVDTGVADSADAIEASLTTIGLDWSAVAHLLLTHKHGDHAGSAADVLNRAPEAVGYAGRQDIESISVPRELVAVADGDEVFGLRIVTTPGHTAGSISILDPVSGLLVAGDAIATNGGRPTPPRAQFTDDMEEAKRSIIKLGKLSFETLLVGHGEPIETGASKAVAELGATG